MFFNKYKQELESKYKSEISKLKWEISEKNYQIQELKNIVEKFEKFNKKLLTLSEQDAFRHRFYLKNGQLFLLDAYMGNIKDWSDISYRLLINFHALNDSRIASSAELEVNRYDNTIAIRSLDTEKPYWRMGLASFILKYVDDFAKKHQYQRIFATVNQSTPIKVKNLVKFYQENGYRVFDHDTRAEKIISEPIVRQSKSDPPLT